MNMPSVRTFLPALRSVDRELQVPPKERLRILWELESDLEALSRQLEGQGLDPAEARRQAEEALVPGGSALRELSRVHAPLYRRLTGHISDTRLRAIERSALGVTACGVVFVEGLALMSVDLLSSPSPFMWPVLALSGLLALAVLSQLFRVWIKADDTEPSPPGPALVLVLAALVLATGIGGAFTDFLRLAASLESAPDPTGLAPLQAFVRISALLSVSLLVTLAGALCWFVQNQWLSFHASAREELLGAARPFLSLKRSTQK